jgi:hypothetical protein
MGGRIKSKNVTVNLSLYDRPDGMIEVESPLYKGIGIEIKRVDPTHNFGDPFGAVYVIAVYKPTTEEGQRVKSMEYGYDRAWIMADGTILHRKDRNAYDKLTRRIRDRR